LCDFPQINEINKFNHENSKWERKLTIEEKFLNFHGCELRADSLAVVFDTSEDERNEPFAGWRFYVIQAVAKKFNGTAGRAVFQDKFMQYDKKFHFSATQLNMMFEDDKNKHFVQTFLQTRIYFIITPSEKLTSFEKMLKPFDVTTWYFLIVVFSIAFCVIFVVNRMSNEFRDLIYGKHVQTPTLNVLRIFFGLSQVRLPDDNFPRIILVFFIYFCLIIRCGYQGVIFEMITSDIHKKAPETIHDLITSNYTIFYDVPLSNTSLDIIYEGLLRE
jgi:hypothetical protein